MVASGSLLCRKVWQAVGIGSFFPKLRYFTDQSGPKGIIWKWVLTILNTKINATDSYGGKRRWKKWCHLSEFVAFAQNWDILQTRMDQSERGHENEIWLFPNTMSGTVRMKKVDGKIGSFV